MQDRAKCTQNTNYTGCDQTTVQYQQHNDVLLMCKNYAKKNPKLVAVIFLSLCRSVLFVIEQICVPTYPVVCRQC